MASQSPADRYGIPPRPPTASTALWTHILRPGTQPSASHPDISSMAPPAKPLDKNAASMRILLHDTQAHFEKFTVHAEKLLNGVKESKHEIKSVQGLFERNRESLVGDIIDLVNRAQTEIQKAVGSPAQTSALEDSFKDMNHRLNGLEQRLDALQAFNQSHTQALQTQIQATQILLDKQGTILSTLAPLLPLLQAVPLHVDALKAHIQETLLTHKPVPSNLPSSGWDRPHSPTHDRASGGKRKRSDAEYPATIGAAIGAPLKRRRTGHSSPSPVQVQLAADHEQHVRSQASPLASRTENRMNADACTDPAQLSRSAGNISPDLNASRQKDSTPGQQRQQQQHAAATPRRPLMDLLLPLPTVARQDTPPRSTVTPRRPSQDAEGPGVVVRTADPGASASPTERIISGIGAQARAPMPPGASVNATSSALAPNATALAPQGARPPRILRVQASFANGTKKKTPSAGQTGVASSRSGAAVADAGAGVETSVAPAGPAVVHPSASSLHVSAQKKEDGNALSSDFAAAANNDRRVFKLPAPNFGQQPAVASSSSSKVQMPLITATTITPTLDMSRVQSVSVSHGQNQIKRAALESVLDRTRQTPVREPGRRFIALVDSEDEDDEEFE